MQSDKEHVSLGTVLIAVIVGINFLVPLILVQLSNHPIVIFLFKGIRILIYYIGSFSIIFMVLKHIDDKKNSQQRGGLTEPETKDD